MFWKTISVVHFYVNQETIEAEHCVNIERPELNCHGQCHLKEVLAIDTPSSNESDPIYQNTIPVFLFGFTSFIKNQNTIDTYKKQSISSQYLDSISEQEIAGIDRPPQHIS